MTLSPFADASRALLGVACVGRFSDEGLARVAAQVTASAAALARTTAPLVAVSGPDDIAEAAGMGGGLWVHYRDDGTRWLDQHGPASAGWRDRDAEARDGAHAVVRAVGAGHRSRRRAVALVFCGDESNEYERACARELAEDEWRQGTCARVEYVGEPTPVCWLDSETTGRAPNLAGMIEVGCVACDSSSKRMLGQFELRLHIEPWAMVEAAALVVNQYDPARWAREAVSHDDGVAMLMAWLPSKFRLACFNIGFDRAVIKNAVTRAGHAEPGWVGDGIDPLPMVRRQLKHAGLTQGAKLVNAAAFFRLDTSLAHTALADTHLARLVYLGLLGEDVQAHAREVGL